jgi:hypothetical protein
MIVKGNPIDCKMIGDEELVDDYGDVYQREQFDW